MHERPDPASLTAYKTMLHQHTVVGMLLKNLLAHIDQQKAGELDQPIADLLEQATRGQNVARKLIESWHRDVAAQAEWREASEAAIRTKYDARRWPHRRVSSLNGRL